MSTQAPAQAPIEALKEAPQPEIWLRASIEDAEAVNFDAVIAANTTSEASDLGDDFKKASEIGAKDGATTDDASGRMFSMLAAVLGMHFKPEHRNEPFGPMLTLADGRRSPAPEDFRGEPVEALAYVAEHASHPALRARLSDICWLLERKRGQLGTLALSAYVELVQKIDSGELRLRFEKEPDALHHEVRNLLRRALQIGRGIGWDKPEVIRAKLLLSDLRKRANGRGAPIQVHWFSELDLDFGISDPAEVGAALEDALNALSKDAGHEVVNLWRLAARAYHLAKKEDDALRCQAQGTECLVREADQNSAMLSAHTLSQAIAELHGIPGKKDRRNELRHQLIDVQARIPDELSVFSQEMDLSEIARTVEKALQEGDFFDRMMGFAALANSPEPDALVSEAAKMIQEHPLSSLFGASHHDREGKVFHRTPGGGFGDRADDPAIQQQIALGETMRRKVVASGEIEVARLTINGKHYLSDNVFVALLRHSPFIPTDLVVTFAHGFSCFFRGDFVSATYILTPLLENSLRHVLKGYGHDVTIFDDATQTQQDRTISSLFEQMHSELDAIFGKPITTDIENVFLKKPGPSLRHAVSHGLMHDGDPYGADAIYGCWLIMRLCLMPLFRGKEQLKPIFAGV